MAGAGGAMSQSAATVLLAAGWKFEHLGLAGLALIVAAPFAWLFSGYMADRVCNHLAKRRGGHREPEHNLINVICPVAVGIIGVCVFGYAAANIAKLSSAVLLLAVFFFVFSSSCVNTTIPVFLVESYPDFAG